MEKRKQPTCNANQKLAKKQKVKNTTGNKGRARLKLWDLPLDQIFSYLPVHDLKNLRLVSTRLSEDVLKIDHRFRVFKIRTSTCLSQNTAKIVQHNLEIELVVIDDDALDTLDNNEIKVWLKNHSKYITRLKMINSYSDVSEDSKWKAYLMQLSILKEVRKLTLKWFDSDIALFLLSLLGCRLEELELSYTRSSQSAGRLSKISLPAIKRISLWWNEIDFTSSIIKIMPVTIQDIYIAVPKSDSYFHPHIKRYILDFSTTRQLDSLKHLSLSCNREFISRFLQIVPVTIESMDLDIINLSVDAKYLELPQSMNNLDNLKKLKIVSSESLKSTQLRVHIPDLTTQLLSISLTRLHLDGVDLTKCKLVDIVLPSLKVIELHSCGIKNKIMASLLNHSESLTKLVLENIRPSGNGDVHYILPVLTQLELRSMRNVNWLSAVMSACAGSLDSLQLECVDFSFMEQVTCDLVKVKTLKIKGCTSIVNGIVRKCQTSLESLHLSYMVGPLEFDLPKLKELTVDTTDSLTLNV